MLLFRPGNLAILALAAGMIRCAYGAVVYDESINGDLSNSGLSPTVVSMALGSNQVWGTVGTANGVDLDYFTFTIQAGLQLSSITVLPGTQSGGALSFIGLQSGSQVTVPPDTQTAAGLLGWWHYSPSDINTDILAKMATPAMGSTGFTPPLPSGATPCGFKTSMPQRSLTDSILI